MYVRPPSDIRSELKVPENYSGNAFRGQERTYGEMPPPLRTNAPKYEAKHSDIPPRSDIPLDEIRQDFVAPPFYTASEDIYEADESQKNDTVPVASSMGTSIFSSLLPKGGLGSHFPFGHGIGSEELLILAVMLMVFLSGNESGEVDSEFILLLGLLLFAG